jgi:rod shape determining protein RodA
MALRSESAPPGLRQKLGELRWGVIILLMAITGLGLAMLYSAAHGDPERWALKQGVRFAAGMTLMVAVALVDIRFWLRHAYTIYAVGLALLVAVAAFGVIGMGARRWIDLGPINIQPSEIMKIALVLTLARYYHARTLEESIKLKALIVPALIILAPAALVIKQPDLGTAILLMAGSTAILFAAGVRLWTFAAAGLAVAAVLPVGWHFLHDYQRERIYTFLDPERDPLGAGYHITQSKIALGSGGIGGKGFLQGTQSHLYFLPERQTDFIFTMLAEELGMIGAVALIALYVLLIGYGIAIALRARHQFGRLVAIGITSTFFLYMFINIAMVTGLVPVVGVPLPLVSYGGTAMITLLFGFGLLLGVHIHRDVDIPRPAAAIM